MHFEIDGSYWPHLDGGTNGFSPPPVVSMTSFSGFGGGVVAGAGGGAGVAGIAAALGFLGRDALGLYAPAP
ncbi:MAG: hypothetical protein V2A66_07495 [Pseudomonadota bacterium]